MRVRTVLLAVACFAAGFGVATWLQIGRSAQQTPAQSSASPDVVAPATSGPSTKPTTASGPWESGAASATARSVAPRVPRRAQPDEPPAADHADIGPKLEIAETVASDVQLDQAIKAEFGRRATKTVRARFLMAGLPVDGVEINGAKSDAE